MKQRLTLSIHSWMVSKMNKFLKFFNLLDGSNNLSITNIALIILLTKIAINPALSLPEVSAFFLALLNYSHKRAVSAKTLKEAKETKPAKEVDLSPIQDEISKLSQELNSFKEEHEKIVKVAEDTQKLVSQANLAAAFTPRGR